MSKRKQRAKFPISHSHAPRPTISACLIVRDEEANLPRCLASIKPVVDEIIVVDTGSTDSTPAVAESFGAKVFGFDWTDDFAAARNESLRRATGDWILHIDADEALIQSQPDALRTVVAGLPRAIPCEASHPARPAVESAGEQDLSYDTPSAANAAGPHDIASVLLTVRSPSNERGSAETVGQQPRLFRNHVGLHFEGRIHEQLRAQYGGAHAAQHPAPSTLYLHHLGYIDSGPLLRRKSERNRRLLAMSIADEPLQPAHHFNLGRQLVWEGRFSEALAPLQRAIELWTAQGSPADGYVPSMLSTAALAASKLDRWDMALALLDGAPEHAVSSELVYVAGVAAWRQGQPERAEQLLTRAWQDPSLARGTGFDPSTAGWRPLSALAELYDSQGRFDDARAARTHAAALGAVPSEARPLPGSAAAAASSPATPPENDIRISACLIVRDEEANLPRCLGSLRGAVDELIVVDTGSQDRTVELAEQHGARVVHFTWCDDFAAARNESLRHASGHWILWIDADDELLQLEPDALRALTAQPYEAHWLQVQSLAADTGEVGAVTTQCRFFRNGLGMRFQGRVHEQLTVPPDCRSQTPTTVMVRHWGYIPSGDVLDRKCERNRRLLQLEIAGRPTNPFLYYMLGKQYVWQHAYEPALEALQQAIRCWQEAGRPAATYVGPLFAVAACTALNLGRPELALAYEASCPAGAMSSDLLYYAAIACQRLGQLDDALGRLQRAVGDPTVRHAAETDPATAGWRSWYLMSRICHALGRPAGAYSAAAKAMESMPATPAVLLSFAAVARDGGHLEDARRAAERALAGNPDAEQAARARDILSQVQNPPRGGQPAHSSSPAAPQPDMAGAMA
jgi:glycosyltransferase involved in cell wall biosynthesis/Flp pilus assembly protein TadD